MTHGEKRPFAALPMCSRVNPAVARIRIDQIFPNTANVQLTF